MKKLLTVLAVFALTFTALTAQEKVLEYGKDYTIVDSGFGSSKFKVEGTSIYYGPGTTNNNHAVLFKLADPSILQKGQVIEVEYKFDKLDTSKDAQIVIQPSSESAADYSKQNYPVIYNSKKPIEKLVFTVNVDNLLSSSVKKKLCGFRMINNKGTYQNYVWQDDYQITVTKVTLKSK